MWRIRSRYARLLSTSWMPAVEPKLPRKMKTDAELLTSTGRRRCVQRIAKRRRCQEDS